MMRQTTRVRWSRKTLRGFTPRTRKRSMKVQLTATRPQHVWRDEKVRGFALTRQTSRARRSRKTLRGFTPGTRKGSTKVWLTASRPQRNSDEKVWGFALLRQTSRARRSRKTLRGFTPRMRKGSIPKVRLTAMRPQRIWSDSDKKVRGFALTRQTSRVRRSRKTLRGFTLRTRKGSIPCFVLGNFSSSVLFIVALQKIRFFPVCQSILTHVHVLVVCALFTVLVGLLVPCLQCIVCNVHCRVNTNLHAACWFFVPHLQSVCLLSCRHRSSALSVHPLCCLLVLCSSSAKCVFVVMPTSSSALSSCAMFVVVSTSILLVLHSSSAKCVFVVMSTSIFSAFCASTVLLVGSSFLICKVYVRCHVNSVWVVSGRITSFVFSRHGYCRHDDLGCLSTQRLSSFIPVISGLLSWQLIMFTLPQGTSLFDETQQFAQWFAEVLK